jgi:transcriptional regulator with XRE-family HTH domain
MQQKRDQKRGRPPRNGAEKPGRDPRDIEVGKRIEQLREARGLKQTEFARMIGVRAHTLNGWEHGKPIRVENAIKIRELTRVSLDWLLCGDAANLEAPELRLLGYLPKRAP